MPAQPASNIKWNENYFFGSDTLISKSAHGAIVAAVIAGWSATEAHLGRTFATLIGAKQPVTMRMYAAARSFEVQSDLLKAAVDEILSKRDADLFDAALAVLRKTVRYRNQFAHWIWGASADPSVDALLLVEPRTFWHLTAAQIKYGKRNRLGYFESLFSQPRLRREDIWVYRLSDLEEAHEHINRAFRIAEALRQFVSSKGERRRVIYRWLTSEADIQTELSRKTQKRQQPSRPPQRGRPRKPSPKKAKEKPKSPP